MRRKANNLKRKLKREHFSSKIELNKGNIKETWKTINQLVNKRSKTTEISTIREGDRVISDPTEIADSMNQFFCSVGKDLTDKIPNEENPLLIGNYGERKEDVEKFAFVPVNPENVIKACKDFKTSKWLWYRSYLCLLSQGWHRSTRSFTCTGLQLVSFNRSLSRKLENRQSSPYP